METTQNVLQGQIYEHYKFLSHFTNISTRYKIEALYNLKTKDKLYPIVGDEVQFGMDSFDKFKQELKNELEKLGKQENWVIIEKTMKNDFLPIINHYFEWYEKNKEETQKFEPANFYEWMYEVMRSTEKEINKWFKVEQPAAPERPNIEAVEGKIMTAKQKAEYIEQLCDKYDLEKIKSGTSTNYSNKQNNIQLLKSLVDESIISKDKMVRIVFSN